LPEPVEWHMLAKSMTKIQAELKTIAEEAIPGLSVDYETDGERTLKELGIDSLDKLTLLLGVQEKWSREFSEEDVGRINSLNDICEILGPDAAA
jgi:acyl carrier protein